MISCWKPRTFPQFASRKISSYTTTSTLPSKYEPEAEPEVEPEVEPETCAYIINQTKPFLNQNNKSVGLRAGKTGSTAPPPFTGCGKIRNGVQFFGFLYRKYHSPDFVLTIRPERIIMVSTTADNIPPRTKGYTGMKKAFLVDDLCSKLDGAPDEYCTDMTHPAPARERSFSRTPSPHPSRTRSGLNAWNAARPTSSPGISSVCDVSLPETPAVPSPVLYDCTQKRS